MENIIIIGSGPAGLTAATYAARANLNPLVLAGNLPGGQLTQTTEIENFPGFPTGIVGFELMANMQKQAERLGARVKNALVKSVEFVDGASHKLILSNDEVLESKAVIIATGASPRWLGIPSEEALKNKGVSACATCDGAFFKGVPVAVVGGGDTAMEEAVFLTHFASKVYIIHRRDQLRASKVMQDRALQNDKIEVVWDSVVEEVLGVEEGKVIGLRLKNVKTAEIIDLPCEALFMAVGHIPTTKPFVGQLEMDNGYIVPKVAGGSATSVSGVFVAGDCADHVYRQAITAAGMGCMAAIDAERWLSASES